MKSLEREALLADRESVLFILEETPETDPLGRLSFQWRLDEINNRLQELEGALDTRGSVALMFSGNPVFGARAIDAGFASAAVEAFQDLIQVRVSGEEIGEPGARGPIRGQALANLAITDIVRGSMGFVLEESSPNENIADSAVKTAIDDMAQVVFSTGTENEEEFENAVGALNNRLIGALKKFFVTLDDQGASVRIVENERDLALDAGAVHRGRLRVDAINVHEQESEQVVGEVIGIVPSSKRFEMTLSDSGEMIKGTISTAVAESYLQSIHLPGQPPIAGRVWRVKMRIREITERNKPPRRLYTLLGLLAPAEPVLPPR